MKKKCINWKLEGHNVGWKKLDYGCKNNDYFKNKLRNKAKNVHDKINKSS